HALAPDADLLLANWESDRPDAFLEAVRWARAQGARVLSCSLIMPSWSDGEGGGPVHAVLNRLLGSGQQPSDVLCFASAGNTAQRHWCGQFSPDAGGWHQWAASTRADGTGTVSATIANRLRPWGEDRVAVELYGPLAGAYELHVTDAMTGRPVGQAVV